MQNPSGGWLTLHSVRVSLGVVAATLLVACSASGTTAAKSSDNTLSGLTVSVGAVNPAFSPTSYAYGDAVLDATTSITFTATASSSKATILIIGTQDTSPSSYSSGSASPAQTLKVGFNLITISVFAEDGSVRIYNLTVNRA